MIHRNRQKSQDKSVSKDHPRQILNTKYKFQNNVEREATPVTRCWTKVFRRGKLSLQLSMQVLEHLNTIYLTLYSFANSTFVTLINDFLKEHMSSGAVKYTDITKYYVNMVCVQCRFSQVSVKLQNVMSSHASTGFLYQDILTINYLVILRQWKSLLHFLLSQ